MSESGAEAQPTDTLGPLVPFEKAVIALRAPVANIAAHRCKVPPALAPAADSRPGGLGVAERAAPSVSASPPAAQPDIAVLASAVAASKLGLVDQLSQTLATCLAVAFAKDAEDRTCLHYAAGYGHEECVSLLLEHRSDTRVRDANGDVPLHFAAIHGHPMCAYNITKACPSTCLTRNYRGQTPVEVAVACERGEVLNAMLLACAGDGSTGVTVQAMRKLLSSGAVPDTWAPNGSSALMLAAAANGTDALGVLLEAGATLELQDALGRSALMFAAGNCARDTLLSLLDAGACISQRDRRGRNVLDYAPSGSEVRRLLQARLDELEAVATKLQQDLLASLVPGKDAAAPCGGSEAKAAAGNKKKKQSAPKKASSGAVPVASKVATAATAGSNIARATTAGSGGGLTVKLKAAPPAAEVGTALASDVAIPSIAPMQQQAKAAFTAIPKPTKTATTTRGTVAVGDDDGDASAWQTVSSHKCATGKQRQQRHQDHQDHQRAASTTCAASAATAAVGCSSSRQGRAAAPNAPALQAGRSRGPAAGPIATAAAPTQSVQPPHQATKGSAAAASPSLATGMAAPPDARGQLQSRPRELSSGATSHPSEPALHGGNGSGTSSAAAPAAVSSRKQATAAPELTRVPFAAAAASSSSGLAAACGFKAALLGLDASQPPGTAEASTDGQAPLPAAAAAAVHLEMPPIAMATAAAAVATSCLATQAERKPAWGGVKLGAQPASITVAGCSPRSYPPLSGAAAPASCHSHVAPFQSQAPTQQPQAARGGQQQQPQQPMVAAAADSCADSSSAAAGSVPHSVASAAESDASSTGHSSCNNTGAGASSPRSFGHDWTRPSPVDVLLHAALAASGGPGNCAGGKRPGHSKSSSDASSSHLSLDGGAGGLSSLDAVLNAPAPPPVASSCFGGLGVSGLGGMEVPPPRRSAGGRDGSFASVEMRSLPSAACLAVGSPNQSSCGLVAAAATAVTTACVNIPRVGATARRSGQAGASGVGRSAKTSAGGGGGPMSDVARLKADNETLQRRLRQAEQRHSQELACVIMDVEQHEAAVVERAIAQERLRITANLLAIGLCPEAILAVITPPGHVMDSQQQQLRHASGGGGGTSSSSGRCQVGVLPGGGANHVSCSAVATSSPPLSSSSSAAALAVPGCREGCSHSSCDSSCALSGPGSNRWDDGSSSGNSTVSGLSSATTAAQDGGQAGSTSLAFSPSPSPAIAIPSAVAASSGYPLSTSGGNAASAGAMAYHSHPSRLPSFGSPGGLGARFGGGSFGSGGLVSSLCAGLGLGLGLLSNVGNSCRDVGMGPLEVTEEDEDDGEMDLPACGDISALLAMSDDDDA